MVVVPEEDFTSPVLPLRREVPCTTLPTRECNPTIEVTALYRDGRDYVAVTVVKDYLLHYETNNRTPFRVVVESGI